MTTAHRPTWAPAMGGEEQGGNRMVTGTRMLSAKDLPGYQTMKQRKTGQNSVAELEQRDLKAELEAKERKHFKLDKLEEFEKARQEDLKLLQMAPEVPGRPKVLVPRAADADDEDADDGEDDESDDDDDEDDLEALQAELTRIKQEREEERLKREAAERERLENERKNELLRANPVLREQLEGTAGGEEPSFKTKRRWDDDVVFKNQARNEPKQAKRFINDTVRSDFHRRFLDRYIR